MEEDYTEAAAAEMGPAMYVFIAFYVVIIVLIIAAQWRIYEKAGKPGWACLIPFYNHWVLVEIIHKPTSWFWYMLIPFVNIYFGIAAVHALSKAFGKDVGFTLLMIFVPFVAYPMLAFGDAQYQLTDDEAADQAIGSIGR